MIPACSTLSRIICTDSDVYLFIHMPNTFQILLVPGCFRADVVMGVVVHETLGCFMLISRSWSPANQRVLKLEYFLQHTTSLKEAMRKNIRRFYLFLTVQSRST